MEKKEFRDFIKKKFKDMGFKQKNSGWYKFIDEDYVIGFDIDPFYGKAYQCTCGCLFLTETERSNFQFNGYYDFRHIFVFPRKPENNFDIPFYEYANTNIYEHIKDTISAREAMATSLIYENFTVEQMEYYFNRNFEYYFTRFFDRNYAFNELKKQKATLYAINPKKFSMFCKMFGFDEEELKKEYEEYRKTGRQKFLEEQISQNGLSKLRALDQENQSVENQSGDNS